MSSSLQKEKRVQRESESKDGVVREGSKEVSNGIGSLQEITIPQELYDEMVETLRETRRLLSKI